MLPKKQAARIGIILRAGELAGASGRWFTAWYSGRLHLAGADPL